MSTLHVESLMASLDTDGLINDLQLASMKINYPEFIMEKGSHEEADRAMERVYGSRWTNHRETIWQWYDEREMGGGLHEDH